MNEIIQNMMNRRSIRKYNDEPVDEKILEQIVEAGRYAPTGGNCQSVHFTVITNQELLETLRECVKNTFAKMEYRDDLYISLQHSIRLSQSGKYSYDYDAPALVVVSNVAGYPNAIADSACAIQNMMLAATSLGVGSCWINQLHWLEENADVRELLSACGISQKETICGAMAVGNFDGEFKVNERIGMKVDWVR